MNYINHISNVFNVDEKVTCMQKLNHKKLNSEENSKRKSLFKCQSQKIKHIKRMDNNGHIPDLIQAFSYAENGGPNLVL